jgi:hypothetical protein
METKKALFSVINPSCESTKFLEFVSILQESADFYQLKSADSCRMEGFFCFMRKKQDSFAT